MGAFLTAAIIGGAVLQTIGQQQQNRAQAEAERQNALFFEEQAKFIEIAGSRELSIFNTEASQLFGDQVSTFARAGVDISGSALQTLAATKTRMRSERQAIETNTKFRASLARMRGASASRNADFLGSDQLFATQALANIFGAGTNIASVAQAGNRKSLLTGNDGTGLSSITDPNKNIFGQPIFNVNLAE